MDSDRDIEKAETQPERGDTSTHPEPTARPGLDRSATGADGGDLHLSTSPSHRRQPSHASHTTRNSIAGVQPPTDSKRSDSLNRVHSAAPSAQQPPATPVPRARRRGLFARLTLIAEVSNPYAYTRRLKWSITTVISIAGAAAPMGSSIVLPALTQIAGDFNASATVVNLSVAMFMLSMAIFPLWWSAFSETLGRRTVYIVSFVLYVVFNVLAAVATNVGMFVAMRCLSGGAAASVQAVGAGTIADVWEAKERGTAMGIFYLGPLCGPLLAPIIGGALAQNLGWRSAQWFMVIYGAVVFIMIIFCLPETLMDRKAAMGEAELHSDTPNQENEKDDRPQLTRTTTARTTHSVQQKTTTILHHLHRWFLSPLRVLLALQFPPVALCVAYASLTFGSLYILNISVQQTFSSTPYNYSPTLVGVLYVPNSAGYFLSSILGGRWVDAIMAREAAAAGRRDERGRLIYRPEDRMRENAWLAAFLWPAALVVYGWCASFGVHVAVPMVANFFFGLGSMLIFAMVTTMLTEFMPARASGGVAVNNFVRNIFSCVGAVVAEPLIGAVGSGALFTGLGVLAVGLGSGVIWAMRRWAGKWREGMEGKMERVMGG